MQIVIQKDSYNLIHGINRILSYLIFDPYTVNSEIFARVLFSRNFAYAKFHEYKTLAKCRLLI